MSCALDLGLCERNGVASCDFELPCDEIDTGDGLCSEKRGGKVDLSVFFACKVSAGPKERTSVTGCSTCSCEGGYLARCDAVGDSHTHSSVHLHEEELVGILGIHDKL